MLTWLVTTDPSSFHNSICILREENTGLWLHKSPEYSKWKEGQTPLFWFYGIPGSGKTVLFSHIVEDVRDLCNTQVEENYFFVYYYCYFGRNQDESTHLLRWAINQLARHTGYMPGTIRDFFNSGEQPPLVVLIEALAELCRRFDRVYILVDALDESLQRANLLRVLQSLISDRTSVVRILAMSREEPDIKFTMACLAHAGSMSLSNTYVDKDIATYIRSELEIQAKPRAYPTELKLEIEKALVKGAQGM